MFFWNINALVHKLKTNTLSAYEQAQYYVVVMLCVSSGTVMQQLFATQPTQISKYQIFMTWLAGCVVFTGATIYCYYINKRGDNKDFLVRMVTLMFTGGIRYGLLSLLALIPASMVFGLVIGMYVSPTAIQESATTAYLFGSVFGLLWAIGLYWYIGKQFKKITQ